MTAMWLAGYAVWWISLVIASWFPMIGKRHRYKDWERLNRR